MVVTIQEFFEETVSGDTESNRYLETIQVKQFWKEGYKGGNVVVAVIDTGCDINHPSLGGKIIDGYNFTDDSQGDIHNYQDFNGHGTHVTGVIVGEDTGVAPEAKVLTLKILNKYGNGKIEDLIKAIRYALDWNGPSNEKVRIICLSLGGKENRKELHEVIKEAVNNKVSVVVASGNDGDGTNKVQIDYPGYYNEVIQVGALYDEGHIATFSNHNNEIDLVAPGSRVYSTYLNGQYKKMSGTSMAAPFVAGSLALIIQAIEGKFQRSLSETEVYAQLIKRTKAVTSNYLVEGNGQIKLFL
ncbi:S8 family peptidase [Priestia megaterium]|uniref:S8 family peptidase n=2 Tax=Priestia megaterium TaxID=1404 RepID=UPI003D2B83D4